MLRENKSENILMRSSTQKVFPTNLHAYIYTTAWNKYTSTKNTYCSFRFLSHSAYLETLAFTGQAWWWRSYHFSRPVSVPADKALCYWKSPRSYFIVSPLRPRNWIRCFLRPCTVFKSVIGIRLLCISNAVSELTRSKLAIALIKLAWAAVM